MGKLKIVAYLLCLTTIILSCTARNTSKNVIEGTGTILYLGFEGGFHGIVTDDGTKYDPINLPQELQQDGLRVKFKAKIRNDVASFHMWGTIVELTDIQELY